MSNELVIYHGSCYDGFTSAWVARKAMPECELYAARYNEPPPNVAGKYVYVLDFSYPRDVMIEMHEEAKSLLVLDHHKTAQADCEGLDFCTFDMERSGCRMAWNYFYPAQEPPGLLLAIEDRDLWRFKQANTRQAHAYVASRPMTLENWTAMMDMPFMHVVESGQAIQGYIETYIAKAAQEARPCEIGGVRGVCVNVPYQNASEMGDFLLATRDYASFSCGYFQRADGRWQYSLRSRSEFDVSELAKQFGGGGHAQAAGFDTPALIL